MSFVCRYWFQTVGWRISSEKLKSGQFAFMSTIRRRRDVKSATGAIGIVGAKIQNEKREEIVQKVGGMLASAWAHANAQHA